MKIVNCKLKIFTNKGLTLIELLVTMGIIGILSGILFVGQPKEERKLVLQLSAYNLSQDLREVQEMAMGVGEMDCGGQKTHSFGIYFHSVSAPESYFLFADCNGNKHKDESDIAIKEVKLEKRIKLCSASSSPLDVMFTPPEPIIYINGNSGEAEGIIALCLKSDESQQKRVKINTVGRIEIE